MTRLPLMLSLAALVAIAAGTAEARPARPAKPQPNAAIQARAAAMTRFETRMSRLDALMGGSPSARTRSANAEP